MDLEPRARRRRGEDLENAILAAAWAELVDNGYGNFTIDAVAERAGTSRSVLYRRWLDRDALVAATVEFGVKGSPLETPDTGTLRGDIIELLRLSNASRAQLLPLMSVLMGSYFSQTGVTFADLRLRILGDRAGSRISVILDRAVARGEADPDRLTPRVRTVAFDLFRHDLLMTLKPLAEDDIEAIVDEIFLPLVAVPPAR
jgi:AcrR family transcriptional regulator